MLVLMLILMLNYVSFSISADPHQLFRVSLARPALSNESKLCRYVCMYEHMKDMFFEYTNGT